LFVAAALVVLALAGCSGPGEEAEAEQRPVTQRPEPLSEEELAGLEPMWFPGLSYTYHVTHAPTGDSVDLEFVVLDGPGTDWTLDPLDDTPEQKRVLAWALYWGLPLGPVDFEDYEPRLEGASMDWFSFPLEPGRNWQGVGPDGKELTFHSRLAQVGVPGGESVQAFHVSGLRDDQVVMEYTYSSRVGWFVSLWWDATGDTEAEVRMDLLQMDARADVKDRPLRAPVRVLDLLVEGPVAPEVTGLLPGDPGEPGAPLALETVTLPSESEQVFWLSRFTGGPGLYEVSIESQEEDPVVHQWTHEGPEEASRYFHSVGTGSGDAEARVVVLAPGTAHLVGYQMVPPE
jgi:hypothetical protein